MKRTFAIRIQSRANQNFGAVDYRLVETVEEVPEGLRVTTRAVGVSEGESFDQKKTWVASGVSIEAAAAYRLTNGYAEVTS